MHHSFLLQIINVSKRLSLSILILSSLLSQVNTFAQDIKWENDGHSYYTIKNNEVVQVSLPSNTDKTIVSKDMVTVLGSNALTIEDFYFSDDRSKVMIYTHTNKVWRLNTEGDYYVLDLASKKLHQIGKSLPKSSLRFAKFSPDGSKVAYVSLYNIYMEDLQSQKITQLTKDGNRKLINGTFDWAYEEEFACRDGFQWSPDGQHISFWQLDARQIRDYYMMNMTDSVYSKVIPVEYPTSGQNPSPARIGVINVKKKKITWQNIPGDPAQHYIVRMEWNNANEFLVQQLNRKQNESKIYTCNALTHQSKLIATEKEDTWIDVLHTWQDSYGITFRHRFQWMDNRSSFLWTSEKDGWRHVYKIGLDGKEVKLTHGDYDVMEVHTYNEATNELFFMASPNNATQKYLYKTTLDGKGKAVRLTPAKYEGTHEYSMSPDGKFAFHTYQNAFTKPVSQTIAIDGHANIDIKDNFDDKVAKSTTEKIVEFFKLTIPDGTEMDAFMVKPKNFDVSKKYPVVFYVYTEPWGANVKDVYGVGQTGLYRGNMRDDGYIYIAIDNRGTPAPKGRKWRKSIYRKIGQLNISDQAMAAREILKWNFVDPDRIAVWGWSGGGSATLNLMFQHPDIYKTGISVAAVGNQLTYDNIYQERYMGLPQENLEDFINGSPITHAKHLKGNLLYIHGTADDNVHYNNAEMLLNELIKHNKQFQFMPYPNRSHGISEGQGTYLHLSTLFTEYLKKHCPGGGK